MAQRVQGTRRVWLPAAFFGAFALVILTRLVQLQVLDHEAYAAAARSELNASTTIYASRGSILDRNGNVLAASVDTWDIYVNARAWKDEMRAKTASEELARALETDPAELRARVAAAETVDVLIRRDVAYEIGKQLLDDSLDGVILRANTDRVNPEGDVAASVLGFIGLDNVGLAGIEAAYNDVLQGEPGRVIFERDTTNDFIPFGQYVASEPEPGKDVVLTIDRYLQQTCEQYLVEAVERHHAVDGGSIIMMDPMTGELLCLATTPSLKFSELDLSDPDVLELLKNRAVTDLYEPGSVMKVITAAAAIDVGAVTPHTTYVDTGSIDVAGVEIKNWRNLSYGAQTMTGVLVDSINTGAVFMMNAMEATSPGSFQRYLEAFGFGETTGMDLQGEATAIFRYPDDAGWSPVDAATQAFGQSISVTPIQMLTALAATINGGNLLRPHLVKAIISPNGTRQEIQPEVMGHPITPETSAEIREMLHAVVDSPGRSHPGNPHDYLAGGKSGTANVPIGGSYNDTQIASFVGFAPLDNPRVLVLVKLNENQDLKTGTEAAAPIFASLAEEALHYMNVRPDAEK
ncbi:MAG: penicillin-binding protein 2, partial [Dehalococcoidia bacterium]|nr:penicillin-binding protein 2 [Dehalococcoidia bacterium]